MSINQCSISLGVNACSHRSKAKEKAKNVFYVCLLHFDIFFLFFDPFRFRPRFCLVSVDPKRPLLLENAGRISILRGISFKSYCDGS